MVISVIEFMTPTGWWGLLGLLIPLGIHLLSKREQHVIPFGSLRFLQIIESDSARSIQLSQYLLLLLRLLLIGLICLLLVGPFLNQDISSKTYWIEEGIYNDNDYTQIINDISERNEIKIFSHEKSDSSGVYHYTSIWTLVDQLNTHPDSSVVYSHSLQKNLIGSPVRLRDNVEWKIVPYKTKQTESSTQWSIIADEDRLGLRKEGADGDYSGSTMLSLTIEANGHIEAAALIKKVVELSKVYLPYDIEWINADDIGKKVIERLYTIIVDDDESVNYSNVIHWNPSNRKLEVETKGQSLFLRGNINREHIIDVNLPVMIAACFNNYITEIYDYDQRVMSPTKFDLNSIDEDLVSLDNEEGLGSKVPSPMHGYILLLIAPVFLVERFVNYRSSERS